VASIKLQGDNSGTLTIEAPSDVGNNTITLPATTQTLATQNSLGVRNLIINGDMRIAQRGTSATLAQGYNTIDRLFCAMVGGAYTQTQDTDVPSGQGFAYSVKTSCTSALSSPAGGDVILLSQKIEGQNLQHLKKGTSNAESLTISFWIKSNQTGTFVFSFRDQPNSRRNNNLVTIDTADTWEKKTITIEGDTIGTIDNDNTVGLELQFWLGQGSNYDGGTHVDGWHTEVTNGIAAGTTYELFSSTSNYINITGVQLEVGDTATPFEHRPYDMELARCQRYCVSYGGTGTYEPFGTGVETNGTNASTQLGLPVQMRGGISLTSSNVGNLKVSDGIAFATVTSISLDQIGKQQVMFNAIVSSGLSSGRSFRLIANNSLAPRIIFTSEL